MVFWLCCLIGILTIIIIILFYKIFLLKKSADDISESFAERVASDTNILIDISSRDRHMRKLANSINEELLLLQNDRHRFQQGDQELKEAVTNISHDLRTPLTAISGYLDLLDKEEKPQEVSRYILIIRNRIEIMKQLTEELFRYSIVLSPEYDTSTQPLSINSILEESILGFYAALQAKKITPNIHIPEKRVIRKINRAALSRIFANLINNAIKYSDGDLDIILTETGEIIFSNTASDLNEIQVERLFDRFYTVETARKSTGLGLSIARILVEQMNGTITANFENGKLSITIQLPENM